MSVTVQEYLRQLKEKGLAEETVLSYRLVLKHFEKKQLTEQVIRSYISTIGHYQLNTKRGCLEKLKRYLKQAKPELAKAVIIPKVPKVLPKDIPSQEEVTAILNKPDVSTFVGLRDRVILELLYSTGLRKKELWQLKVEDIDPIKQLVRVNQGKNKKDRIVPISKVSLEWVVKYLTKVRPMLKPRCNHIFLDRHGEQMGRHTPYSIVKKYSANGCHKYRHAYATHLLQNGMKETSLQRLLGHSLITTTQVYTKVTIQDLQHTYQRYHPRDRWAR